MAKKIEIFLSYSRKDRNLVEELKKRLKELSVLFPVDIWDDTLIRPGEEWKSVIDLHFNTAEIILLFISTNFLDSSFCQDQMVQGMRLHNERKVRVLPILLDSAEWRSSPFAKLQLLPYNALPVTEWTNQDEAWIDVVNGISQVVEDIVSSSSLKPAVPSPSQRQIVGPLVDETGLLGAVSDVPITDSEHDKLDFKRYVDTLYAFITAPQTTTPLVISINGSWGMGKSSLMGMLKQRLEPQEGYYLNMYWQRLAWRVGQIGRKTQGPTDKRADWVSIKRRINELRLSRWLLRRAKVKDPDAIERILEQIAKGEPMSLLYYPTVWFNAWKFTEEGQIWAALASDIINQLNSKKYALLTRLQFWFQLKRKRANLAPAVGSILLNLLIIVILASASVLYPSFIHPFISNHILPFFKSLFPTQSAASSAASTTASIGGFALFLATALRVARASYKIAKTHPFQIPINNIIENPNYQEKIGYISQFSEDFKRIVSVATRRSSSAWQTQKLVIFIDDLDRCRPLQAAGIIEAISLFFDSEQCVFVMGIDIDTVAASIEAKYKELAEKVHHDKPGIVSFGKAFLEKIIQITLNIPHANETHIRELIASFTQGERDSSMTKANTQAVKVNANLVDNKSVNAPVERSVEATLAVQQAVQTYFGTENVQNATIIASRLLKYNPRRTKQFINLFRLKLFFLNREDRMKRYLEEGEEVQEDFALMLAWSIQWAEVAKLVVDSQHSAEVCDYLLTLCEKLQMSGEQPSDQPAQVAASAGQPSNTHGPSQVNTMHYDAEVFDKIIQDLITRRSKVEKFPAHWYYLPWEEWIYDDSFRFCVVHFQHQWQAERDGKPASLLAFVRL